MMRKNFLCLVFAAFALATDARAAIEWLSTVYDFGAFDEDTKSKTAEFRFVNTGDEDVSIIRATATCGCTTPSFADVPIAPGDTAVISVSYDPTGRPGRFSKDVYIRTSVDPERHRLTLRGTVIGNPETVRGRYPYEVGDLKLQNSILMIGTVTQGTKKTANMDGYNAGHEPLVPRVTHVPRWLEARVTPDTVSPGEQVAFDFIFDSSECDQFGIVTDSLTIVPKEGAPEQTIQITAIVKEDFSGLTPEQLAEAPMASLRDETINFGRVAAGTVASGSTSIVNRGRSPLLIRRVYSQDSGVEVNVDRTELQPGEEASIMVNVLQEYVNGEILNKRLSVITNDPMKPIQTVRAVGEVQ